MANSTYLAVVICLLLVSVNVCGGKITHFSLILLYSALNRSSPRQEIIKSLVRSFLKAAWLQGMISVVFSSNYNLDVNQGFIIIIIITKKKQFVGVCKALWS